MTNSQKIYDTAKANLGRDFSTDNNLGCAETVNAVVKLALGYEVGGGASTALMYKALKTSKLFVEVSDPQEGDIVISPTGTGNGGLEHGHVGIVGDGTIMANNSLSGKLQDGYYTVRTWKDYFGVIGGFPTLFYRAVDPITVPVEPQKPSQPTQTEPLDITSFKGKFDNITQSTTNIVALILVLSLVTLTYLKVVDSSVFTNLLYLVFGVKTVRSLSGK